MKNIIDTEILKVLDDAILDICGEVRNKKHLILGKPEIISALAELVEARALIGK